MASARYITTLDGALAMCERRLERYTANHRDAPIQIWHRLDTIKRAIEMAEQRMSDREIREYLKARGVETL
jgi:hypothetical protein